MKAKQFRIAKWMGDDRYSWAVFRKGYVYPVVDGCSRGQAKSYADDLEKQYGPREHE